jgi:hypothetical protein
MRCEVLCTLLGVFIKYCDVHAVARFRGNRGSCLSNDWWMFSLRRCLLFRPPRGDIPRTRVQFSRVPREFSSEFREFEFGELKSWGVVGRLSWNLRRRGIDGKGCRNSVVVEPRLRIRASLVSSSTEVL